MNKKPARPNLNRLPGFLIHPATFASGILIICDLLIRPTVHMKSNIADLPAILSSWLTSWLFFWLLTQLWQQIDRRYPIFNFLLFSVIFALELLALILAYYHYFYFGEVPGYYAVEYILQEPADIIAIISNIIPPWYFALLALAGAGCSALWQAIVRNSRSEFNRPGLITAIPAFFILSAFQVISAEQAPRQLLPDVKAYGAFGKLAYRYGLMKEPLAGSALYRSRRLPLPALTANADSINLLLILNESLRRKDLAPFQTAWPAIKPQQTLTPRMCQFLQGNAEHCFIFPKAYANATITMLSTTSLLTGAAPVQSLADFHRLPLLFDYGRAAGWQTAFISSHSFAWRNLNLFFESETIDHYWNLESANMPVRHDTGTHDSLMIAEWRRLMPQLAGEGRPFLAVLQSNSSHYPYYAANPSGNLAERYRQSIQYGDTLFGEIIDSLAARDFLKKTVIIYTSDHGEAFGEHDYNGHVRTFYEEESGIPFWIYIPKPLLDRFGRRIGNLSGNQQKNISNLDLVPTALALMQFSPLPDTLSRVFMGASLLDSLGSDRPIYFLNNNEISNHRLFRSCGLKIGDMKYLLIKDAEGYREELFDLAADPAERENLLAGKAQLAVPFREQLRQFPAARKLLEESGKN